MGRENRLVRAEQQRLLYGAIERVDRLDRLGLYYTVDWELESGSTSSPEKLVFFYKQAGTGNKVLEIEKELDPTAMKGTTEFQVSGEAYQTGGRVLAWRAELYASGELQAYEQSYLWE